MTQLCSSLLPSPFIILIPTTHTPALALLRLPAMMLLTTIPDFLPCCRNGRQWRVVQLARRPPPHSAGREQGPALLYHHKDQRHRRRRRPQAARPRQLLKVSSTQGPRVAQAARRPATAPMTSRRAHWCPDVGSAHSRGGGRRVWVLVGDHIGIWACAQCVSRLGTHAADCVCWCLEQTSGTPTSRARPAFRVLCSTCPLYTSL